MGKISTIKTTQLNVGDLPERQAPREIERLMTVADRVAQHIGRIVVIEGTFPLPVGNGQVAYAPAKGKVMAVYVDGFDLMEDGDVETTTYMFANIRSIAPITEIAMPSGTGRVIS